MFDSNQRINREIPIPLYYQLQNIILDMINSGELQPGDYIPTESELGQMYQLSRTTVRQAIMGLVMEGAAQKRRGMQARQTRNVGQVFSRMRSWFERNF